MCTHLGAYMFLMAISTKSTLPFTNIGHLYWLDVPVTYFCITVQPRGIKQMFCFFSQFCGSQIWEVSLIYIVSFGVAGARRSTSKMASHSCIWQVGWDVSSTWGVYGNFLVNSLSTFTPPGILHLLIAR